MAWMYRLLAAVFVLAARTLLNQAPRHAHDVGQGEPFAVVSRVSQGMGVALVPAALGRSAMAGTVFVPLDRATTPYDTHCLWKTARDNPALALFVQAVRDASARPSG